MAVAVTALVAIKTRVHAAGPAGPPAGVAYYDINSRSCKAEVEANAEVKLFPNVHAGAVSNPPGKSDTGPTVAGMINEHAYAEPNAPPGWMPTPYESATSNGVGKATFDMFDPTPPNPPAGTAVTINAGRFSCVATCTAMGSVRSSLLASQKRTWAKADASAKAEAVPARNLAQGEYPRFTCGYKVLLFTKTPKYFNKCFVGLRGPGVVQFEVAIAQEGELPPIGDYQVDVGSWKNGVLVDQLVLTGRQPLWDFPDPGEPPALVEIGHGMTDGYFEWVIDPNVPPPGNLLPLKPVAVVSAYSETRDGDSEWLTTSAMGYIAPKGFVHAWTWSPGWLVQD